MNRLQGRNRYRFSLLIIGLVSSAVVAIHRLRTSMYRQRTCELESEVAQRTRELATLLNAAQTVSSTLELQPLLDLILEQLLYVVDYAGASIQTLEGDQLSIQSFVQRPPSSYNYSQKTHRRLSEYPALDRVVTSQRPLYIPDLMTQGRDLVERSSKRLGITPETMLATRRSWLAIPIINRGEVIGVLTVTHWQPNFFTWREQTMAQTFTNYVATAIANAQLHEQAQLEAVEAERHRITREMHDSLSQTLFAVNATAQSLPHILDNQEASRARIAELIEMVNQAQSETRTLLSQMRSKFPPNASLHDLLCDGCAEFSRRWRGELIADVQNTPVFPADVQTAFYYIAQEALSNVGKHAQAQHVLLNVTFSDNQLVLKICDDGCGFDTSMIVPGHFGQSIMRERATMIGADLDVTSQIGSGSKLTLTYTVRDLT